MPRSVVGLRFWPKAAARNRALLSSLTSAFRRTAALGSVALRRVAAALVSTTIPGTR